MTKAMKDSGIEWIGEIPEDWEVVKVKYLFELGRGRVIGKQELKSKGKYPVYSSQTKNDGVLGFIDSYDFEGDMLTWTTDGANAGTVFLRTGKYNCTNVCGTLKLNRLENNLQYLKYSLEYIAIFHKRLDTNGYKIMNNEMANINIILPPQPQQKAIADFLDKKVSEIDNVISKTKKVIKEYKKYKQSLITETVTKGLDENVSMKNSGIEWLGDIPEHWDVIRLRELFKFGSGLTITKSELKDKGIKVINYGEIHSKYKFDLDIDRDELKSVDEEYLNIKEDALVNKGDFVFCDTSEDREGSGNCVVIREDRNELIFAGSHTVTARLRRKENPIYVRYMLLSNPIKEQVSSRVVGIKVYSITQSILKTILGILPPLQEQKQIASYLDKKCEEIDRIIESKEKLIIEMEKYKKSLIYETVTGKREVE
ncbi:MAG TPA: restriction endonuclease subunit S [Tissierellales bacterium]|nr:restriction endonuclease subunit S [Tissierellales bacterium]